MHYIWNKPPDFSSRICLPVFVRCGSFQRICHCPLFLCQQIRRIRPPSLQMSHMHISKQCLIVCYKYGWGLGRGWQLVFGTEIMMLVTVCICDVWMPHSMMRQREYSSEIMYRTFPLVDLHCIQNGLYATTNRIPSKLIPHLKYGRMWWRGSGSSGQDPLIIRRSWSAAAVV